MHVQKENSHGQQSDSILCETFYSTLERSYANSEFSQLCLSPGNSSLVRCKTVNFLRSGPDLQPGDVRHGVGHCGPGPPLRPQDVPGAAPPREMCPELPRNSLEYGLKIIFKPADAFCLLQFRD